MIDLQRTGPRLHLSLSRRFAFCKAVADQVPTVNAAGDIRRCGRVRILDDAEECMQLQVTARHGPPERILRHLFARVHQYPTYPRDRDVRTTGTGRPLLSCIIVLTENDHFVRDVLLPSLTSNSRENVEIIVVSNGSTSQAGGATPSFPPYVRRVSSEYRWVARAYNRGVKAARGRYVALLHDDCLICDDRWIEKSLAHLRDGATAVSPEIVKRPDGLLVAKGVPLVMKTSEYERLGGHDEAYFMGLEDIDFTHTVLRSGGEVRTVDLDALHFNGMSSILVADRRPSVKRLFSCYVLPRRIVRSISHSKVAGFRRDPVFQALEARQYAYFTRKFDDDLRHRVPHFSDWKKDGTARETLWKTLSPETWSIAEDAAALVHHFRNRDGV